MNRARASGVLRAARGHRDGSLYSDFDDNLPIALGRLYREPLVESHAADRDKDHKINLQELLRIIQMYGSKSFRQCEGVSEDDFCPVM